MGVASFFIAEVIIFDCFPYFLYSVTAYDYYL